MHHDNLKVAGTLCVCETAENAIFVSVGVGVNLNSSPVPGTSMCLSELVGNIDVDQFVELLSDRIMKYFAKADINGFEGELLEAV